jgi:dTDP-4-amino-4,6-dideoxygalactose transaminase
VGSEKRKTRQTMIVPFFNFQGSHEFIADEMSQAFQNVFRSNWYIQGTHLKNFELEYANFNEVDFCAGISNGLDAIFLSLKALGVGQGDEVIVPSNTFIATVLAVSYLGAKPVFVEPDMDTYLINPNAIESAITLKTKAIIPVHLYGQACQMDVIKAIATKYAIKIVEDNAQAHGARFKNKMTGSWGDINATSFYPGKNLGGLGDGGGITTNQAELYQQILSLRNYGSQVKYHHEQIGHNMRLDELQAAFLSVKLKYLPKFTAERQEIAQKYSAELEGVGDVILPVTNENSTHVYHLFVIRTKRRDELQKFLQSKGIGTLIHYPIPPHLQKAYSYLGFREGDFPIAEELAKTCLSLPIWPGLQEGDINFVSSSIKDFFNG